MYSTSLRSGTLSVSLRYAPEPCGRGLRANLVGRLLVGGDEIKDGVYGRGVGVGFALRGIGKQGGQRGFERGRKRPVFLLLGLRGQRREEREAETDEKAFEDG